MSDGSSELKVGIFVTAALVIGGILVFVIGNRSAMFASKNQYDAVFESVDGLRAGSPVRIAGIDVGTVEEVGFGEGGNIRVTMEIREDASAFVREGSTASIGSKGLLGDQLVDITVGEGERLPPGSTIPTSEESMLASFLGETGREAEGVVQNVNRASEGLAETLGDPQVQQDMRNIVHNLEVLTSLAQEEDGTVRRLFSDPQMADDLQAALRGLRGSSSELNRTLRGVRRIIQEVERGDGTAHELIYGEEGVQMLSSLALAAGEIATILRDVRTGDNNAHELLYGDEAGNLISNLTAASADLRAIVADVRAGRGTIGGLLVDPSIYEDVKRLVGDLERNEILRALVRYSIRQDRPEPQVPRPEPAEGDGEE
jgi:phospholipid/cholesterol/gamma-HCH transport system substrate-binding protein